MFGLEQEKKTELTEHFQAWLKKESIKISRKVKAIFAFPN